MLICLAHSRTYIRQEQQHQQQFPPGSRGALRWWGLSQAWKADKPSVARQVHAGPACTRMGMQEVQPAWHGPAEQGMTAGGRLGAQGAGPREAKVATRKPPRPAEPWGSSTSNNPPSGPQGWGQAEPAGYIALWVRAGWASCSTRVICRSGLTTSSLRVKPIL